MVRLRTAQRRAQRGRVAEADVLIDRAADVAVGPEAQAKAGNYRKGHVKLAGLDIAVESPAGSRRKPEWPEMTAHYGYIKRTEGADGDHVDVFLRPATCAYLALIVNLRIAQILDAVRPAQPLETFVGPVEYPVPALRSVNVALLNAPSFLLPQFSGHV